MKRLNHKTERRCGDCVRVLPLVNFLTLNKPG